MTNDVNTVTTGTVAKQFSERSKYIQRLKPAELKRYNEIERQFRDDTDNGLTEVEYYELSTLRLMCEDIEVYIHKNQIENTDKELLAEYLRAKEHITDTMRRFRESKKEKKAGLNDIKEAWVLFNNEKEAPKTFDVVTKSAPKEEEYVDFDDDDLN